MTAPDDGEWSLDDLGRCFSGAVPAVLVTASAASVPNVTYLSRAHAVDPGRIALSNQFLSKSARNLAENPAASLLLTDPLSHDQFRLALVFERTERRGRVFERLRDDVDAIAALTGMQDVFRLRAADIFRVDAIEAIAANQRRDGTSASDPFPCPSVGTPDPVALAELCARVSRCADLDGLVQVTVAGLAELLGHRHSMLLLLDEGGERLFTISSHGYETQGVGSEVTVGDGLIGIAAAQCRAVRVGNLRQMTKYARSVRRSFEATGEIEPEREIPVPDLVGAESRLVVPAMALGQLVGVLVVESPVRAAYGEQDAAVLGVVASLLASAIETIRAEERAADPARGGSGSRTQVAIRRTHVRFFPVDGSTFIDGDYLIKGVAGRILWSLLGQYEREGRVDFTNKEVRLDPSLDLPDFRDNFESRLILLKRRLLERNAPVRIEKTGRGRFRLDVDTALSLEERT